MSEDVKLCPICGLKLSPNLSNYNPAENFCPRHSDTRWREYYDALIAERDALRAKLEVAREALNTIYTFGDNFIKVALEGIAVEALQKLEAK